MSNNLTWAFLRKKSMNNQKNKFSFIKIFLGFIIIFTITILFGEVPITGDEMIENGG